VRAHEGTANPLASPLPGNAEYNLARVRTNRMQFLLLERL